MIEFTPQWQAMSTPEQLRFLLAYLVAPIAVAVLAAAGMMWAQDRKAPRAPDPNPED